MSRNRSRRGFLADVSCGALLATLGPAVAADLGLAPRAFADEPEGTLHLGEFEPLVRMLQETPLDRLQATLVEKLRGGTSLKTLVAAGALANARTFGGEDYVGFHTFMAFAPAMKMTALMPAGSEALPVLKVLYRNTERIHQFGGRSAEILHKLASAPPEPASAPALHLAIQSRDARHAEQVLASLVAINPQSALDALLPSVQDNPEVHRAVLPYRAWDMQDIVGPEHALTLLRQSLRYCVKAEPLPRAETTEHGAILVSLIDEFKLHGKVPGSKPAEDALVEHLSDTFATASAVDSARAAASALAEGYAPEAIGEALSLAASQLVLRDAGRMAPWEDKLKPAGCVHGDSVGVHASDAANAWRNLSSVSTGRNVFACLILGAWQVARDRIAPPYLLPQPLPVEHHLAGISATDADRLLVELEEAIHYNLQAHATAIVHRYGELGLPADRLFAILVRYAVSEDGALHAEKYFQTVWDDFHATRPTLRWRHMPALARVTASVFGRPAAGQVEARELLGIQT